MSRPRPPPPDVYYAIAGRQVPTISLSSLRSLDPAKDERIALIFRAPTGTRGANQVGGEASKRPF